MTQFSIFGSPQWVFSELKFADYYIVWLHLSSECEFSVVFRNSDGDDFPNFPFENTWEQNLFLKSSIVVVNWIVSIVSFNIGVLKKKFPE